MHLHLSPTFPPLSTSRHKAAVHAIKIIETPLHSRARLRSKSVNNVNLSFPCRTTQLHLHLHLQSQIYPAHPIHPIHPNAAEPSQAPHLISFPSLPYLSIDSHSRTSYLNLLPYSRAPTPPPPSTSCPAIQQTQHYRPAQPSSYLVTSRHLHYSTVHYSTSPYLPIYLPTTYLPPTVASSHTHAKCITESKSHNHNHNQSSRTRHRTAQHGTRGVGTIGG